VLIVFLAVSGCDTWFNSGLCRNYCMEWAWARTTFAYFFSTNV